MWGVYFCMGAYKRVPIFMGCLFCVFYPDFTVYTLERHTCIAIACHVSIITLHKRIMTGLLAVLVQKF